MTLQNTFGTLYQLRRLPVQCLSTQNILSCSSKQNVLCKNDHGKHNIQHVPYLFIYWKYLIEISPAIV